MKLLRKSDQDHLGKWILNHSLYLDCSFACLLYPCEHFQVTGGRDPGYKTALLLGNILRSRGREIGNAWLFQIACP